MTNPHDIEKLAEAGGKLVAILEGFHPEIRPFSWQRAIRGFKKVLNPTIEEPPSASSLYSWWVEDKPTAEGNYSILQGGREKGGSQVAVAVTKEIADTIVKLARNAPDGKCTDYCDACGEGVSH